MWLGEFAHEYLSIADLLAKGLSILSFPARVRGITSVQL